jgi:hypothetical protein
LRRYTLKPYRPEPVGVQKYAPEAHRVPDAAAVADARVSERRPTPASALLSMGHIASPPAPAIKIWKEGARADFPASPLRGRRPPPRPPEPSKRGDVTVFSGKSRRRLLRGLSVLRVDSPCHTMALTLPGETGHLTHETVIEAFRVLMRRLSASGRFKTVSGYWKRELQKRGALHYHLLLYGLEDGTLRAEFQTWMVWQWNRLMCVGLSDEDTEKHRWWHAREENMQPVTNMGYFAKYVGKCEDDDGQTPLKGRWWASFNKAALPVAPKFEAQLEEKASAMLNRLGRKIRQNRANAGKHAATSKALGGVGLFARLSPWDVQRLRCGYDLNGYRNPTAARLLLAVYEVVCKQAGVRPGKARFSTERRNAAVVLCGRSMPAFALQAVAHVERTLGISISLHETPHQSRETFTPDPLKPVPPRRTPVNAERVRFQSDFLGRLGALAPSRRVAQLDDDGFNRLR